MQVLGSPGIAVCEEMEGVNGSGEFASGNASEMMGNDSTRGENATCVTCGELCPKYLVHISF